MTLSQPDVRLDEMQTVRDPQEALQVVGHVRGMDRDGDRDVRARQHAHVFSCNICVLSLLGQVADLPLLLDRGLNDESDNPDRVAFA